MNGPRSRRVLVPKALPNVPVLNLSFLPHPGAELHQLVEPGVTMVMLLTPFGIYQGELTTNEPRSHVRRLISVTRVNP